MTVLPNSREVMLEAIRGSGFVDEGVARAERVWSTLLPLVEELEREGIPEHAIRSTISSVAEGLTARRRYAAALEARKRRKR